VLFLCRNRLSLVDKVKTETLAALIIFCPVPNY
jgi:hypothetical protein